MEENRVDEIQEPRYRPRPKWQVALAWVGLAIMLVCVVLYYIHIAKGGIL